jgi:hypothetical protein
MTYLGRFDGPYLKCDCYFSLELYLLSSYYILGPTPKSSFTNEKACSLPGLCTLPGKQFTFNLLLSELCYRYVISIKVNNALSLTSLRWVGWMWKGRQHAGACN